MHRPFDQLASGVKSQQQSLLEASADGAQSRRRPQSSTFRKAMKVFLRPARCPRRFFSAFSATAPCTLAADRCMLPGATILSQMVESVEAILDGFKDLSRGKGSNLLGFVISFGPTPINPKESYILRVECRGDEVHEDVSATGLPACTTDSNAQGAARKMIRSMISSGLDQMNDIAPAYKVFCLALVAPTGEAPGGDVQGAYAGWLARNGFVPKLRRCRPVIVTVGSKEFLATECPQHLSGLPPSVSSLSDPAESLPMETLDNDQLVEMSVPEMLWLQHQTSIKGLQQQESCSDCL